MAFANLTNDRDQFDTNNDSIVIVDNLQSIRGGRTLDVTGFTPPVIYAGHIVIVETATGEFKPMPVNGGATAYGALPAGHTYAGITINTVKKSLPMVGILVRGTVNPVAAPYALSANTTILAAVKAALPLIDFRAD